VLILLPLPYFVPPQVLKLGDNQPKVRQASTDALLALARCEPVGPDFVVRHVTKALPKRQTGNRIWRPLESRLQLLRNLLVDHGMGPHLTTETVMSFVKENGATSHTFQEVRTAAREVTVALYAKVGDDVDWEPYLAGLRVKQREEYETAFENAKSVGGAPLSGRRGKSMLEST
jgi:centrosomal protein CEP104